MSHPPFPRDRIASLLAPCFFGVAVAFFVAALASLPWIAGDLHVYFYQSRILAVTHMITLGWISATICGVLYRYVPGLLKRSLPFPRVAVVQCATFVAGVVSLVVCFSLARWTATAWAAGLVLVSVALLCVNLWPLLLRAEKHGVAEVGILLATGFFLVAALLGTLLAVDKTHEVLGGSAVTNLAAHAHLAALGWVGVMVCALSLRFLPAFLLPAVDLTRPARVQVVALGIAVVALAAALLARSPAVPWAGLAVAAALVAHVVLVGRVLRAHRLPIDWTARHAMAGAAWLATGICAGFGLTVVGVDTPSGAHLASAYGVMGLLGWISNAMIGVSYKLFPGFVSGARTERRRAAAPIAELGVPVTMQAVSFVLFNAGVAGTAGGLLVGAESVTMAGALSLACAGVVYGATTMRTLAFVLVDPRRPSSPLAVLP